MAPKSNLGKMGALFSAVLVLICMVAGYVVLAAAGTLNRYTKELNVAKPGTLLLGPALAANELPWYGGQQANEPEQSDESESECRAARCDDRCERRQAL